MFYQKLGARRAAARRASGGFFCKNLFYIGKIAIICIFFCRLTFGDNAIHPLFIIMHFDKILKVVFIAIPNFNRGGSAIFSGAYVVHKFKMCNNNYSFCAIFFGVFNKFQNFFKIVVFEFQ